MKIYNMGKDILSWNDVKEKYLEFHKMDSFTNNMAIDVDFGYWLVNNCIVPDVNTKLLPVKLICKNCNGWYGININHKCFKCLDDNFVNLNSERY